MQKLILSVHRRCFVAEVPRAGCAFLLRGHVLLPNLLAFGFIEYPLVFSLPADEYKVPLNLDFLFIYFFFFCSTTFFLLSCPPFELYTPCFFFSLAWKCVWDQIFLLFPPLPPSTSICPRPRMILDVESVVFPCNSITIFPVIVVSPFLHPFCFLGHRGLLSRRFC